MGSTSLKSSFKLSGETDDSIDEVSYKDNPIEYRQVWIPEGELDDSPVLNCTRVRPGSLSTAYRKKFDESQMQLIQKGQQKLKVSFRIPNKSPLSSLGHRKVFNQFENINFIR